MRVNTARPAESGGRLAAVSHRSGGPPINKNIYKMSQRERRRLKIDSLPEDLSTALNLFSKDEVLREALGEHIFEHYLAAKRSEWRDYQSQVHPWEVERYLTTY